MPISELLMIILHRTGDADGACRHNKFPLLPGPTLILLVAAGYCLLNGSVERGGQLLVTMALLAIASGTVMLWLAKSGSIRGGASRQSILLGLTLAVMGFFVLPLIGA